MKRVLRPSMPRVLCDWTHACAGSARIWCSTSYLLLTILTATRAFAQATPFTVTIEQPGIAHQISPLVVNGQVYGATGVVEENFNGLSPGFHSTGFPFANNSSLGSFDRGQIQKADQFGGAGGSGNYLTVNTSIQIASSPTTLTFNTPQRAAVA